MVELLAAKQNEELYSTHELIDKDEVIAIVDDSPEIALLLSNYLQRKQLPYQIATSAEDFYNILSNYKVALVLLDIGLPDEDGTDVLKRIAPQNPDLGIIMVTGTTDLQVALHCLREGADDYLTKPVGIERFNHTLLETLKKRKLAIDNRLYQKELISTNFRTRFLHQLNLKMNNAYLSSVEVNGILQAILVGITSAEGLKFNRAFLALFDEEHQVLHGRLAIGPAKRADANQLWTNIEDNNLHLENIIEDIIQGKVQLDVEINNLVQSIEVSAHQSDNILILACNERNSINVKHGRAEGYDVQPQLLDLLDEGSFVITPLYSPSKSLGVIIADNFVTTKEITLEDIRSLEIFASQASLAIEHSQLYRDMSIKINELELATEEIERSKDLLVEAEKLSTLGQMSAQVVHAIRNPITALGGTARLLAKRSQDQTTQQFLQIIIKEAAKVEATLEDLFNYVDEEKLHLEQASLNTLLQQSVSTFYNLFQKYHISQQLELSDNDPHIFIDVSKIRQVFHHLIKNSLEAMQSGGNLVIKTKTTDDSIVIEINDTGHGIDGINLNKAKDAFFTTKTYGTGMGLSLVDQILTQHEAEFSLTNNENEGMSAVIIFKR